MQASLTSIYMTPNQVTMATELLKHRLNRYVNNLERYFDEGKVGEVGVRGKVGEVGVRGKVGEVGVRGKVGEVRMREREER